MEANGTVSRGRRPKRGETRNSSFAPTRGLFTRSTFSTWKAPDGEKKPEVLSAKRDESRRSRISRGKLGENSGEITAAEAERSNPLRRLYVTDSSDNPKRKPRVRESSAGIDSRPSPPCFSTIFETRLFTKPTAEARGHFKFFDGFMDFP